MTPKEVFAVISRVLGPDVILKEYKNDYDARLMVQKLIYLLQETTGRSDFEFSWYLAGPYSPELTKVIYGLIDDESAKRYAREGIRFTKAGSDAIQTLQDLLAVDSDDLSVHRLSKARWYELMASARYIDTKDAERNGGPLDQQTLAHALQRAKPWSRDGNAADWVAEEYVKRRSAYFAH